MLPNRNTVQAKDLILDFVLAILKESEINFNILLTIYPKLFQCVINIKIISNIFYIHFSCYVVEVKCVFCNYSTCQFRLVTFQGPKIHLGLVDNLLDSTTLQTYMIILTNVYQ